MPSIFTRIIEGELPAHFLWRDDECVAFMSINPHRPGHALVVPRAEIDHWLDLPAPTAAHLTLVAHRVGSAQQAELAAPRVGLMIAGFEVPHAHLHVLPMQNVRDLDFANAAPDVDHDQLAAIAARLRDRLTAAGFGASVWAG